MNTADQVPAPRQGWFKSSYSNGSGACVEVKLDPDRVMIRDSKDRGHGPIITVTPTQWRIFIDELTGQAPATPDGALTATVSRGGTVQLADAHDKVLTFTPREWISFHAGARANQFDHLGPDSR
jgi:Domain of unknown function (DUF397)